MFHKFDLNGHHFRMEQTLLHHHSMQRMVSVDKKMRRKKEKCKFKYLKFHELHHQCGIQLKTRKKGKLKFYLALFIWLASNLVLVCVSDILFNRIHFSRIFQNVPVYFLPYSQLNLKHRFLHIFFC